MQVAYALPPPSMWSTSDYSVVLFGIVYSHSVCTMAFLCHLNALTTSVGEGCARAACPQRMVYL